MNDHPKFPPNCTFFKKDSPYFYAPSSAYGTSNMIYLTPCDGDQRQINTLNAWRPIIAAVASRAWLKFAKSRPKPTPIDIGEWDDHGRSDAKKMAKEWSAWGEQN